MANHARRLALYAENEAQASSMDVDVTGKSPQQKHRDKRFHWIRKKYFNQLMTPEVRDSYNI